MLYYRFQVNRNEFLKETHGGIADCEKTSELNPTHPWIGCLKVILQILLGQEKKDRIYSLKKDLDGKKLADHHKIYYYLADFFEDEVKDLLEA